MRFRMNGGWYSWGRQPEAYKNMFRNFSTIVKATAPATAMAWLPTVSNSYPFDQRRLPPVNSTEFRALDTNGNGQLDAGDDPYEPFYPGDEYVDWVGGTIYYYGPSYPYINNYLPSPNFLSNALDGVSGTDVFYDRFCRQRNKSLVWAETSIFHWPNGTGYDSLSQKQAWWRLMLSRTTRARYPKFQALAWFEIVKVETAWQNQTIDFAISSNQTVMNAFLQDISPAGSVASNIDYTTLEWGS
ncbi:glycoside hydrolase family 26 protein [Gonapodya prolifera JEL478]|uniref:Glycoside hydrolase family 26 protein n=1 Tax=Gonapodya prolifera (strain JEL478) TaxID=1344416 RepID=A0A139AUZ6_GONPJ|nr:glycoside hydrolase family 26 protein [Gonapodya prolifera JEL478]|eukprot:KXS20566.1 glycoside hydrolase family 26 protein [Gonapodya prolifera JEL478]